MWWLLRKLHLADWVYMNVVLRHQNYQVRKRFKAFKKSQGIK